MPIDWNKVVPGKTVLRGEGDGRPTVISLYGDWVWLDYQDGAPWTAKKDELAHWSIEYPWVEITAECKLAKVDIACRGFGYNPNFCLDGPHIHGLAVMYQGVYFMEKDFEGDNPVFKRDGMRVWRKVNPSGGG